MTTIEDKLKDLILSRFKSIREFTTYIDMPYTTIDSMFRRGIQNSSVAVVIKVCKGLDISADALAEGKIVYKHKMDFIVYENDTPMLIEVKDILTDTKDRLLQYGNLLLDGEPITDETKKAIAHGIDVSVEMAKSYNKKP